MANITIDQLLVRPGENPLTIYLDRGNEENRFVQVELSVNSDGRVNIYTEHEVKSFDEWEQFARIELNLAKTKITKTLDRLQEEEENDKS